MTPVNAEAVAVPGERYFQLLAPNQRDLDVLLQLFVELNEEAVVTLLTNG